MTLFESLLTYGLIFVWLFVTGIGVPPVPEEVSIIAAGGAAASHQGVKWWFAWPACILGVVTADLVLYGAGRLWGTSLFQYRWVKRFLSPERRVKIEDGFHQHGVKLLLSARMLPGLRTGVFLTAGAMRYPFLRFLIADGLYAIPGTGLIFFGSYFFAESINLIIREVHKVQYWLLALVLLTSGGYALYRYFRIAREHSAHDDIETPTLPELIHSKHPHDEPSADGHKSDHPAAAQPQPANDAPGSLEQPANSPPPLRKRGS